MRDLTALVWVLACALCGVQAGGEEPTPTEWDSNAPPPFVAGEVAAAEPSSQENVAPASDFKYAVTNGGITIVQYVGRGGEVTVPAAINGLPVIDFEWHAFMDCAPLTGITIPAGVTNVGSDQFRDCPALVRIKVDDANPAYSSSEDGIMFNKTGTGLVHYPAGKEGDYVVPSNVTWIGDWAFTGCNKLTSLSIHAGVTRIGGDKAFGNCDSMTNFTVAAENPYYSSTNGILYNKGFTELIRCLAGRGDHLAIPDSVTKIADDAFYGWSGPNRITIPAGVIQIGDVAFQLCSSLGEIAVDERNPAFCSVDGMLFDKSRSTILCCPRGKAGHVEIPAGVVSNGTPARYWRSYCSAFLGCSNLTSVTIPDSITTIGEKAFCACTSLANVMIPDSVTNIGDLAFFSCTSLTNVTIGSGVTNMGASVFRDCPSLTGVYFKGNAPGGVASKWTFNGRPNNAIVYYRPGTTGWGAEFGGRPTEMWEDGVKIEDLRRAGAFGFSQAEAQVLCDDEDLRVSIWNDAQYLLVQAILWGDGDDSLGEASDERPIGDRSQLILDVDADQKATPNLDRDYLLNPWPAYPGLRYQTVLSEHSTTGIQSDSKGRGAIRYIALDDGKRVRVETYAIPLDEIGKKAGEQLLLAYWACSPHPELTLNSVGYKGEAGYYAHQLPRENYHVYTLAERSEVFDVAKLPNGREDGETQMATGRRSSYEERRQQRLRERQQPVAPPPKPAFTQAEMEDHLQKYQMQVIREGLPPLPVALTPESKAQLQKEGVVVPPFVQTMKTGTVVRTRPSAD